jgi:hypothetical protein
MSTDMKLGFWKRRRARKVFEKYVSPDVMRLIEKSSSESNRAMISSRRNRRKILAVFEVKKEIPVTTLATRI